MIVKAKELSLAKTGKLSFAEAMGFTWITPHDFDGWRWMRVKGKDLDEVSPGTFETEEAAQRGAQLDFEDQIEAWLLVGA